MCTNSAELLWTHNPIGQKCHGNGKSHQSDLSVSVGPHQLPRLSPRIASHPRHVYILRGDVDSLPSIDSSGPLSILSLLCEVHLSPNA